MLTIICVTWKAEEWGLPYIFCSHGTAIAGLIAGVKDNNFCSVGVAYNATLIGKIVIIYSCFYSFVCLIFEFGITLQRYEITDVNGIEE